jgi:hypothetical protein
MERRHLAGIVFLTFWHGGFYILAKGDEVHTGMARLRTFF